MSFQDVAGYADYLVIRTGYTSRITATHREMYNLESDSKIICIKDDVRGAKPGNMWYKFNNKKSKDALANILASYDGYVVIQLSGFPSPWLALRDFVRMFYSCSEYSYCGCFNGIPDYVKVSVDPNLGHVVLMNFDCESG